MDKYASGEKIGEGAYGNVYIATHRESGRVVALKKIGIKNREEGVDVPTLREIKILREVRHPHIIELLDVSAFPSLSPSPLRLTIDVQRYLLTNRASSWPFP